MRHSKAAGQPLPSAPSAYSASVPISLYREVTSELQSTKADLETLKTQNRQLLQQNQQLRQEIERLAQVVLHTKQTLSHLPVVSQDSSSESLEMWLEEPIATSMVPPLNAPITSPVTQPMPTRKLRSQPLPERSNKAWVLEQSEPKLRRTQPTASDSRPLEMSGWKLGVVIVLITLTAFGAGFLLVRPLLSSQAK